MNLTDINRKITELISTKIERGEIVQLALLISQVADQYPDIHGDDADLYRAVFAKQIGTMAKRCITNYAKRVKEEDRDQYMLGDFTYLQAAYSVERDGSRYLVPIDQLTDEEMLMRAGEMRNMAQGNLNHAIELEEAVRIRREKRLKDAA